MREMIVGFDTSMVIRLLTGDPPHQAAKAKEWLERRFRQGNRPRVTDLVVVETYFALQSHYQVPKTEALLALQKLLESGDVEPAGFALQILQNTPNLAKAQPGFVDRIIHAEIRSLGGQLLTFEKAGAKLPATTVL